MPVSNDPQALYVDADALGQGLAVVWASGQRLRSVLLDAELDVSAAAPSRPSEADVDPPTVRGGDERAWVGWCPTRDGVPTLEVVALEADGRWGDAVVVARAPDGLRSPRTGLAHHPDGGFTVTWRWVDGDEADAYVPQGAYVRRHGDDGEPVGEAMPLAGGSAADRPVVEPLGDCAVVAWETDGTLWMQVLGPDGGAVDAAAEVPADPNAARPYLDIGPDGRGLLSWESEDEGGVRDVGMRRVEAHCPAPATRAR